MSHDVAEPEADERPIGWLPYAEIRRITLDAVLNGGETCDHEWRSVESRWHKTGFDKHHRPFTGQVCVKCRRMSLLSRFEVP